MTGRPQSKAPGSTARPIPVSEVSWLAPLLDPDGMAEALVNLSRPGADPINCCEIEHVRYRPGTSCTVLYNVGLSSPEGPVSLSIYARRIAPGRQPASTSYHSLKPGLEVSGLLLNGPTTLEPGGPFYGNFPLMP